MLSAVETAVEHLEQIERLRAQAADQLKGKIIALASDKGGIGKTTLAVEVAYCLGAVLIDGDWHDGNASRSLGWRHERRLTETSPFLAAIQSDRVPRPIKGGRAKPDLVPSGPDLEAGQPSRGVTATALVKWAEALERPLVVDTHPGGGPVANDACAEAHAILAPVPLAEKDLDSLEGWCEAMAGYPLMLVPSKVPPVPPAAQLDRLEKIAERYELPVASPIAFRSFLQTRLARTAVSSTVRLSPKNAAVIPAFMSVSSEVLQYASAVA